MIDLLYFLGKAYGYEIYKMHKALYPRVTLRVIYYHLKKGVALGEFKVEKTEKSKGEYSWGGEAEKTYYSLGPNAHPKMDPKVKDYMDKTKEVKKGA
jgi:hypothetical protein